VDSLGRVLCLWSMWIAALFKRSLRSTMLHVLTQHYTMSWHVRPLAERMQHRCIVLCCVQPQSSLSNGCQPVKCSYSLMSLVGISFFMLEVTHCACAFALDLLDISQHNMSYCFYVTCLTPLTASQTLSSFLTLMTLLSCTYVRSHLGPSTFSVVA
jgi:hypothetical protein